MIPTLWPALLPFLERACRETPLETPRNLLRKALDGKAAIIVESDEGVILTVAVLEAHEYPERTVCLVAALAGRPGFLGRLPAISEWVDRWAELHGCAGVAIMGRPGWAKVFNQPGVEQVKLVLAYRSLSRVPVPGNDAADSVASWPDGGVRRPSAAFPESADRAH